MRILLFTLLCAHAALVLGASSATVYKWVDENGVTHYSDQPHPGAQKMQVQAAQSYKAQRPGAAAPARSSAPSGAIYHVCAVTRPSPEEMFMNTASVPASVHVDPQLRPEDRLAVLLDGAPLSTTIPLDSEFQLSPVVRGAHSLSMQVASSGGAILCQSQPVTFYVRQPTIIAPNPNANSKANPSPPPTTPPPVVHPH
ncbi:MAG: DUF4124 domain-containing protein [Alphaproteobacteria bacterium]|nr:DUF4124 domain-containing protein [Alphaproteobacteria bacterium]